MMEAFTFFESGMDIIFSLVDIFFPVAIFLYGAYLTWGSYSYEYKETIRYAVRGMGICFMIAGLMTFAVKRVEIKMKAFEERIEEINEILRNNGFLKEDR